MDRFLGRHVKRIDSKGRVSIPAAFRAVLSSDGFEGLFALRSLKVPAVDAGGNALLGEIDALLGGYDRYSDDYQVLSVALLGAGDTLTLDGEGRIVLPDWVRDASGITDEVVFVGQGTRFQFWSPERFAHFEQAARLKAAEIMTARSSRGGTV